MATTATMIEIKASERAADACEPGLSTMEVSLESSAGDNLAAS
jgi:hypothetical protein